MKGFAYSMCAASVALTLTGCFGSDSDSLPIPEQPPAPTEPSPSEPDTVPPTATIVFPASVSKTNASTLTVKGVASDESDVIRVTVNGEDATLSLDEDSQSTLWSVSVPVADTITVETEDSVGNVELTAATANIISGEVPFRFVVDNTNQKVLGWLPSAQRLVQ